MTGFTPLVPQLHTVGKNLSLPLNIIPELFINISLKINKSEHVKDAI